MPRVLQCVASITVGATASTKANANISIGVGMTKLQC